MQTMKATVLVVMVMMAATATAQHLPLYPCEACTLDDFSDSKIMSRMNTCAGCGAMYGPVLEHCCMCHDNFFSLCELANARRR